MSIFILIGIVKFSFLFIRETHEKKVFSYFCLLFRYLVKMTRKYTKINNSFFSDKFIVYFDVIH